jgi:hypothetical protein
LAAVEALADRANAPDGSVRADLPATDFQGGFLSFLPASSKKYVQKASRISMKTLQRSIQGSILDKGLALVIMSILTSWSGIFFLQDIYGKPRLFYFPLIRLLIGSILSLLLGVVLFALLKVDRTKVLTSNHVIISIIIGLVAAVPTCLIGFENINSFATIAPLFFYPFLSLIIALGVGVCVGLAGRSFFHQGYHTYTTTIIMSALITGIIVYLSSFIL